MIEIDLWRRAKTKNAATVPANAGKKANRPSRGLGKAKIRRRAIPAVASSIAFSTSFFAMSSLSRAARYAPTGVRVMPTPFSALSLWSSSDTVLISFVIFRAKAVSVPEDMGLAINRRCFLSCDMSLPLYISRFSKGARWDSLAKTISFSPKGSFEINSD